MIVVVGGEKMVAGENRSDRVVNFFSVVVEACAGKGR